MTSPASTNTPTVTRSTTAIGLECRCLLMEVSHVVAIRRDFCEEAPPPHDDPDGTGYFEDDPEPVEGTRFELKVEVSYIPTRLTGWRSRALPELHITLLVDGKPESWESQSGYHANTLLSRNSLFYMSKWPDSAVEITYEMRVGLREQQAFSVFLDGLLEEGLCGGWTLSAA